MPNQTLDSPIYGSWVLNVGMTESVKCCRSIGGEDSIASGQWQAQTATVESCHIGARRVRLIWLADQEQCQDAVVEGLFRAYFTEGRDIGDRETLLDVVANAGLEVRKARELLSSEAGVEAMAEADDRARQLGVDGVPFFIINNAITLSGAQRPETFLAALRQVLAIL